MKNFLKNTRAATAIEFAIILPVLLVMLLGIVQFGLTLFFDSSLNAGIRAASRQGITHHITQEEVKQIMSKNLGGLYNPDDAAFTIVYFPSFNNPAFQSVKNNFIANPESFFAAYGSMSPTDNLSGQVVLYGVKYKWGGTFGMPNPFLPGALYAFSVVRNEAY